MGSISKSSVPVKCTNSAKFAGEMARFSIELGQDSASESRFSIAWLRDGRGFI